VPDMEGLKGLTSEEVSYTCGGEIFSRWIEVQLPQERTRESLRDGGLLFNLAA
jgi:hypothetical protein